MVIRVGNSIAKVTWAVIIQPRNVGGLGIVDPIDQSRALLGKLVVRGLLPRNELWKILLRERIFVCSPFLDNHGRGVYVGSFNRSGISDAQGDGRTVLSMEYGVPEVEFVWDFISRSYVMQRNFSDNHLLGILASSY